MYSYTQVSVLNFFLSVAVSVFPGKLYKVWSIVYTKLKIMLKIILNIFSLNISRTYNSFVKFHFVFFYPSRLIRKMDCVILFNRCLSLINIKLRGKDIARFKLVIVIISMGVYRLLWLIVSTKVNSSSIEVTSIVSTKGAKTHPKHDRRTYPVGRIKRDPLSR